MYKKTIEINDKILNLYNKDLKYVFNKKDICLILNKKNIDKFFTIEIKELIKLLEIINLKYSFIHSDLSYLDIKYLDKNKINEYLFIRDIKLNITLRILELRQFQIKVFGGI